MHVSHLNSRADWGQRVHLGEADRLAVDLLGLLHHDGGAGLALWPRGGWSGGRFVLQATHTHTRQGNSIKVTTA